jgi:alkanesulfonate monooxygenase SsuD/methylene tetrahydromethanopterin reductase-like flavin-dependent oxidoreductase (luciferase family)
MSNRTPNAADWHIARSIFVAETDAQAAEFARQPGGAYDYYFEYLFKIFDRTKYRAPFVANEGDDPMALDHLKVRNACVIHGSPETVAKRILELREHVGDFGTLLYAAHDWQDKTAMKNSMRLMAEEVMPRVNRALGR